MNHLHRLADRVLNRPLLIHPGKAEVILQVLGGRIGLDAPPLTPNASRFVGGYKLSEQGVPYLVAAGVGLLTIDGSLVNRGAWIGADSGLVSYEGIAAQLDAFVRDSDVGAIVLDLNSPGGEATGMFALAGAVRAARDKKPIVALVNDMAASAAYGIAAQADRIVVSQSSVVGSIGVVLVHLDVSKAMEAAGRTPTLIYAGAHKVDGNPFGPLPDAVRADLQREVETFYGLFVDSVAAGRPQLGAAGARSTEARVYIGAESIDQGLADLQGGLTEAIATARSLISTKIPGAGQPGRPNGNSSRAPGTDTARKETPTMELKDLSLEALRAGRPDLISAIETPAANAAKTSAFTEGKTAGAAEATAAERGRITAIQGLAFAGQETLTTKLIADGVSPPEAAVAFNADFRAKGQHLTGIKAVEGQVAGLGAAMTAEGGPGKGKAVPQNAEGWKAEWEGNADLQAEFATVDAYVGFKTGEARGTIRILNKKSA